MSWKLSGRSLTNMVKNDISIITVSYNQGDFIERTIRSVLFQEGSFYLEYIIIDGGSKDATPGIIKKYERLLHEKAFAAKNSGIDLIYISEPDEGPTHALNKGLRLAKCKIIGFLNSDDTYPEGTIEKIVQSFISYPETDVIYGNVLVVDENDRVIGTRKGKQDLSLDDFKCKNALIQPEVFLRKEVTDRLGFFDESLGFVNDYEYWIRALKNNIKFTYAPDIWVNFRKRKTARSSGIYPESHIEYLTVQYRNFGLTPQFFKNFGKCAFAYSEKTGTELNKSFLLIKEGLEKHVGRDIFIKRRRQEKRLLARGYIKKALLQNFENRKVAVAYFLRAFSNCPPILCSKNGLKFCFRTYLCRKDIYFLIRNLVCKIFNRKYDDNELSEDRMQDIC